MCGRYVAATPADELAAFFGVDVVDTPDLGPRYNVAPTDDVYGVVAHEDMRHLDAFMWGLVPNWADSPKVAARMINARAETLAANNSFRPSLERRRCLVPADGFYEWLATPSGKQPVYATRRDGQILALAGLWNVWRDRDRPSDPVLRSLTIVTTEPNAEVSPIHDRMPVIVEAADWETWLSPDVQEPSDVVGLLRPAQDGTLEWRAVSKLVNKVANDGPELLGPPEEPALF